VLKSVPPETVGTSGGRYLSMSRRSIYHFISGFGFVGFVGSGESISGESASSD
jgi:hypothetical protein